MIRDKGNRTPETRFATFHSSHLFGVILGPRISKSDTTRLYNSLIEMLKWNKLCFNTEQKIDTVINIFKANQITGSYHLAIEPYAKLIISKSFFVEIKNLANISAEDLLAMEKECNDIVSLSSSKI